MKRSVIIGFLILLALDTFAQVCFKHASMDIVGIEFGAEWLLRLFTGPWIYGAIAGYIGTFLAWMSLLRDAPVGPAVAASNMELVTVTFFSVVLFNEPLNSFKIVGGGLILLGVFCLAKGEAEMARRDELRLPGDRGDTGDRGDKDGTDGNAIAS